MDFLVGTWTFTDPEVPLDTGLYALRCGDAAEISLISAAAAAVYYGALEPGGESILLLHNDIDRSAMSRHRFQPDGSLAEVGRWDSGGRAGSYIAFDPSGRYFIVANAHTGWAIFRNGTDPVLTASMTNVGSGPHPRQTRTHPHCAIFSPDRSWIYAADMGADEVLAFAFDTETGEVTETIVAYRAVPGSGPRHVLIRGERAYLLNELGNTLVVLSREDDGWLRELQSVSTLPADFSGDSHTAHLDMSPDGRHIYVTNRGHDSVAVFDVDGDGSVVLRDCVASGGRWPWFSTLTGDGHMLVANNLSDSIAIFRLDGIGVPQPVKSLAVHRPIFIAAVPDVSRLAARDVRVRW